MNLILKKDRENAEIIKMFADSFRRYIDMDKIYSTIFEETIFIDKYIRIQNYRMGNKICYTCICDDTLYDLKIPKLTIQPFIENAVIHGIGPRANGGLYA